MKTNFLNTNSVRRQSTQLSRILTAAGLLVAVMSVGIVPSAHAACAALPTDKGQASVTVSVPTPGSYRLWSRIYAPSAGNDSFYLQVDQTTCSTIVGNSSAIPAGQLTWVDYSNGTSSTKIDITLSAGNHTILLAGREASVGVDKILLLSNTSCTPTGDGSNCQTGGTATPPPPGGGGTPTPTPGPSSPPTGSGQTTGTTKSPAPVTVITFTGTSSTVPITIPTGGVIHLSTPAENTQPSADGTIPGSESKTKYLLDGKPLEGTTIDTMQLCNGRHVIEARTRDAKGSVASTIRTVDVNNTFKDNVGCIIKADINTVNDAVKKHTPLAGSLMAVVLLLVGVFVLRHRVFVHLPFFRNKFPHLLTNTPVSPQTPSVAPPVSQTGQQLSTMEPGTVISPSGPDVHKTP